MSVKTHVTDFNEVAPCSATKQVCPYGGDSDKGVDGHLVFENDAQVKRYNELAVERENGGSFGSGISPEREAELNKLEKEATDRAVKEVKYALHNVPIGTKNLKLRSSDKDYSGYTGAVPAINGAVIEIEETGEILKVETEIMGENLKGTRLRMVSKLYNESGEEVTRYIPGPKFRIVSIPDTIAAKSVLQHEVVGKEALNAVRSFENVMIDLQSRVFNEAKKDVSISEGSVILPGGQTRRVINVRGANKDGSKSFAYRFDADGNISQDSNSDESLFSKKVGKVLQENKDILTLMHDKRILRDEATQRFVDSQNRNLKYNDYV